MTSDAATNDKVDKRLAYARWVWLIGSAVAVVTAVSAAATTTDPEAATPALLLAAGNVVLAAIAVPAALALRRRANWARLTLFVLSAMSAGTLAQSVQMEAWASVALNIVLATPIGVLVDRDVKAACKAASTKAPSPPPRTDDDGTAT